MNLWTPTHITLPMLVKTMSTTLNSNGNSTRRSSKSEPVKFPPVISEPRYSKLSNIRSPRRTKKKKEKKDDEKANEKAKIYGGSSRASKFLAKLKRTGIDDENHASDENSNLKERS